MFIHRNNAVHNSEHIAIWVGIIICIPYSIDRLYNMISYRRETALQGALVLATSGRLELGDNILRTL